VEMGRLGEEPEGEVLRDHSGRATAARQDHRRLAAHVHPHRALPRLDRGSRAGGRLMSWRSVAGSRLRALFRRDRLERELDDEVQFHLEMQADDNVRAGMDPDEARRAARRSFGGRDAMKETYRARRTIHFVETMAQDVRYAAGVLRRTPTLTTIAVLTLALGIATTTTVFGWIDGMVLHPFRSATDDGQLAVLESVRASGIETPSVSYADSQDFQDNL